MPMPMPMQRTRPKPTGPPGLTFLEYVTETELGRPTRRAYGQSHWPCPECGHRSFHTLPPKTGCRDRFVCFRCSARGDEYDLLKITRPGCRYPEQQAILAALRAEYDRLYPTPAADTEETAVPLPPPETRTTRPADPAPFLSPPGDGEGNELFPPSHYPHVPPAAFSDETARAADEVDEWVHRPTACPSADARGLFKFAAVVLQVAADRGVDPAALAGRLEFRADLAHQLHRRRTAA